MNINDFKISKINSNHYLEDFTCGQESLDYFLKEQALKETQKGESITYVITYKEYIVSYYTLVCSAIIDSSGGEKIFYPAIELKMFALDDSLRGKECTSIDVEGAKYSDVILWNVIENIDTIRREYVGAKYITLYSVPYAIDLYKRNGFEEFDKYMSKNEDYFVDGCIPMYMRIYN